MSDTTSHYPGILFSLLLAVLLQAGTLSFPTAAQQSAALPSAPEPAPVAGADSGNSALDAIGNLERQGRFVDAEQQSRDYLRDHDRSAAAHELLAYALLRENKPRDAIPEFQRAAQLHKPTSTLLLHVGQAYVLLNDDADADKWTSLAVATSPRDADAWYGLGRIRYSEQRFESARQCFEQVLHLAPESVKAADNLGLTLEAINRPEDAAVQYRRAIAWQRSAPPAMQSEQPLLNLGTLLLHQGQLAEAEQTLAEAARLRPESPRVNEQLGQLAMRLEQYAVAEKRFARAVDGDPENGALRYLHGQALKRQGRQAEARAELARSSQLKDAQSRSATP